MTPTCPCVEEPGGVNAHITAYSREPTRSLIGRGKEGGCERHSRERGVARTYGEPVGSSLRGARVGSSLWGTRVGSSLTGARVGCSLWGARVCCSLSARRQLFLHILFRPTLIVSCACRFLVPRRSSYILEGVCVCLTQICRPLHRGQTRRGWYVRGQSQIPLAWEGWVAQPVDRSQAFTGRVPTSGHIGGTA